MLEHTAEFSLLNDRRRRQPYGLEGGGGEPGGCGDDKLMVDGEEITVDEKEMLELDFDSVVGVQTLGGDGYGPIEEHGITTIVRDRREGRLTKGHISEMNPQFI